MPTTTIDLNGLLINHLERMTAAEAAAAVDKIPALLKPWRTGWSDKTSALDALTAYLGKAPKASTAREALDLVALLLAFDAGAIEPRSAVTLASAAATVDSASVTPRDEDGTARDDDGTVDREDETARDGAVTPNDDRVTPNDDDGKPARDSARAASATRKPLSNYANLFVNSLAKSIDTDMPAPALHRFAAFVEAVLTASDTLPRAEVDSALRSMGSVYRHRADASAARAAAKRAD